MSISAPNDEAPMELSSFASPAFTATFDDLNDDSLVAVLSFLLTEEMNDANFVNRRVYEARNDPSLNQIRTAIVRCKTQNMPLHEFFYTIATKQWARIFAEGSNYTRLKVEGQSRHFFRFEASLG